MKDTDWQHLKPFGYAPGDYIRECGVCKSVVSNLDKRAITCRPCAEKAYAQAEQPAEPVALQAGMNNADLAAAQQGESIEQGMRKECEEYIAVLKADLAAALKAYEVQKCIAETESRDLAAAQAKIAGNAELIAKFVKAAADAEAEAAALRAAIKDIGDFAHDSSTGPAVPDTLWEIRRMAYTELMGENGKEAARGAA